MGFEYKMRVKELIELLKLEDPDRLVYIPIRKKRRVMQEGPDNHWKIQMHKEGNKFSPINSISTILYRNEVPIIIFWPNGNSIINC
jgi:hypothetical protein